MRRATGDWAAQVAQVVSVIDSTVRYVGDRVAAVALELLKIKSL